MKSALIFLFVGLSVFHEYHVSVCDINFNTEKQLLEVTHRIFADDLENTLKMQNIHLDVMNRNDYDVNDPYFEDYLKKHIKVKANTTNTSIVWLGHQVKSDLIVCYYEVNVPKTIDKVHLSNTVLMELFRDQKNIVHWKKDKVNVNSVVLDIRKPVTNQEF
jgi:hypothetical protein